MSVIEILISGGNTSAPYYNFHDSDNNFIDFSDAKNSFYFIHGTTYRFKNNGISTSHPLRIQYGSTTSTNMPEVVGSYIDITADFNT